jgi:hypothetical protein
VASSTLAVRTALHRRINSVNPTCTICGIEEEDSHHALIRCTLANALRQELRVHWDLPTEEVFKFGGKDWFFLLLCKVSEHLRPKIIFMLWRVWHHRNNIVHGDGKASVSASVPYLCSYLESFISANRTACVRNGKGPADLERQVNTDSMSPASRWSAPREGELKANVDA